MKKKLIDQTQDHFKCFKCNFETSKLVDYQAHKVDHMMGRASTIGAPIKPQSIGPVEMPDEIMQDLLPKPEKQAVDPIVEPPTAPPKPIEVKKPEAVAPKLKGVKVSDKIKLVYKYEGTHDCGAEVDTLFIDIEDKYVVVCYCNSCKEQIMSRPVTKL